MSDLTGYTFSPDLANRFRASLNSPTGAGPLPNSVGQALQVLSLHLPNVLSGSPIAPDALLRGSRGFTPDAAVRGMTTGNSTLPPAGGPMPRSAPIGSGPGNDPFTIFNPSPSPGPSPAPPPIAQPIPPRVGVPDLPRALPTPAPSIPLPTSPTPGPAPIDQGPTPTPPPGMPNFVVNNPGSALPTPGSPLPPGGGVGGNPLADLLDAFLRGGGGQSRV